MSTYSDSLRLAQDYEYNIFGETITYSRGENAIELTAIRETLAVGGEEVDGVNVPVYSEEFRFPVGSLDFGAGALDPRRGDQITDSTGNVYDYKGEALYMHDSAEWRLPVTKIT